MLSALVCHARIRWLWAEPRLPLAYIWREVDRARQQGFNGFLGKPINSTRFPQNLRTILAGQQVWEV